MLLRVKCKLVEKKARICRLILQSSQFQVCAGEEISSVPSEEILPELTALRITRTRIESLPRGAFSNRSIEVLSLDRNSIASIERWDVIC